MRSVRVAIHYFNGLLGDSRMLLGGSSPAYTLILINRTVYTAFRHKIRDEFTKGRFIQDSATYEERIKLANECAAIVRNNVVQATNTAENEHLWSAYSDCVHGCTTHASIQGYNGGMESR